MAFRPDAPGNTENAAAGQIARTGIGAPGPADDDDPGPHDDRPARSGRLAGQGLSRVARSSSFRFMLIYAGLFTLSVLVLFTIVGITTNRFVTHQVDFSVSDELDEVRTDAGISDTAHLRLVINGLIRNNPRFFYLLEDPRGSVVAGNMDRVARMSGPQNLEGADPPVPPGAHGPLRGTGAFLRDGGFLFVAVSDETRDEMLESLFNSFLLSLGAIIVLGFAGGLLMSMLVLRRIETVSRTTRAIMAGDLSQRIPLNGSGDEFDDLSTILNAMLERIETLIGGMRQISNDVAHDLRTPLSRLRQRLELARLRDTSVSVLHEQLDCAIEQVDSILATFSALLRIAQVEARSPREGFTRLALADIVQPILEAYGPVADETGQHLSGQVAPALWIEGDRALLSQLLVNLIENALRHTPAGSRVRVTGEPAADAVVLSVEDDGPGIAASQRDYVLGRFARLDASRSTPGSGLGLSLVKAIAGLHGATLRLADSRPGDPNPGLACVLRFPTA